MEADGGTFSDFSGDVRGFIWGLRPEDIRNNESGEYIGEFQDSLTFDTVDQDARAFVSYFFSKGALWKVQIKYDKRHSRPQQYLDEYIKISNILTERYGKPTFDTVTFSDPSYRSDTERWGMGAIRGLVKFETRWQTDRSIIGLVFSGKDFRPDMRVIYISRTIVHEEQGEEANEPSFSGDSP